MPQILHISVYGAKTEAATSGRIASLERVRFALSFDANNSIFSFARKCTFSQSGLVYNNLCCRAMRHDVVWCNMLSRFYCVSMLPHKICSNPPHVFWFIVLFKPSWYKEYNSKSGMLDTGNDFTFLLVVALSVVPINLLQRSEENLGLLYFHQTVVFDMY